MINHAQFFPSDILLNISLSPYFPQIILFFSNIYNIIILGSNET